MKRSNVKKQIISIAVTVLAAVLLMTGCGGSGTPENSGEARKELALDFEMLAENLTSSEYFDTDLSEIDSDSIGDFITLDSVKYGIMYMGNGTYTDSFGAFEFSDEAAAKAGKASLEEYVKELSDTFAAYLPEEAKKADDAAVIQKGRFAVFCIASDSEAVQSIIEDAFYEKEQNASEEPEPAGDNSGDEQPGDEPEPVEAPEVQEPEEEYPVIEGEFETVKFPSVFMIGNRAYELYSYVDETAEKYAAVINEAAEALKGEAKVYDVIVPLSSGIQVPDSCDVSEFTSNQDSASKAIAAKLSEDVTGVNLYPALMRHRNEYIYFRTDHHWTAAGAYYGYEAFCEAAGIEAIPLKGRKTANYGDFLGSFYEDTKSSKILSDDPDRLMAYFPVSENIEMQYTTSKGESYKWDIINDVSKYPIQVKYSAFIASDNPFTEIENKDMPDAPVCAVVKESFGNAFVPFLADHYSKIYVIDYRYWEGNLTDFVRENGVDDVIFINNLSMIRGSYLTGKLAGIIKQ